MSQSVELGVLTVTDPRMDDERRTIREHNFEDCAFQDFAVKNDPRPLGDHFHRQKSELFYFLEGGGVVRTCEVTTEGAQIGKVIELRVFPGCAVLIPPLHTHHMYLDPGTHMVCFSSKPFDPTDMPKSPIVVSA